MIISFDITRLVPRFILNDRNGFALAHAIKAGFDMANKIITDGMDTLTDIDKMPEWRLDEMAWEEYIVWYDYGADIGTKRELVRDALKAYRRLGTPAIVEGAIDSVYHPGVLEEWFQYEGEPYYFRVWTSDTMALLDKRRQFEWLVENTKNVRSVLENVYYYGYKVHELDALGAIPCHTIDHKHVPAEQDYVFFAHAENHTGTRIHTATTNAYAVAVEPHYA